MKRTLSLYDITKRSSLWSCSISDQLFAMSNEILNEEELIVFEIDLKNINIIEKQFVNDVFVKLIELTNNKFGGKKVIVFVNPENEEIKYFLNKSLKEKNKLAILKDRKSNYLLGKISWRQESFLLRLLSEKKISIGELNNDVESEERFDIEISEILKSGYVTKSKHYYSSVLD